MLKESWAKRPTDWRQSGCKWLWVAVVALLLDQITKIWVANTFSLYESVALLPSLNFTYVHNTGAAFSFLADAGGWQRWAFAGFASLVCIGLWAMLRTQAVNLIRTNLAYVLILGGAAGNLIDRVVHGYVIDFIDFYVGQWHWPAFNVADSVICIGAALLILDAFLQPKNQESAG